jgi:hypothetical protein
LEKAELSAESYVYVRAFFSFVVINKGIERELEEAELSAESYVYVRAFLALWCGR